MMMAPSKRAQGLTLIEMMLVVAILGIIATFATSEYQTQARKSKRSDAIITLAKFAQAQKSYLNDRNTYAALVTSLPGITVSTSDAGYYTITVAAGDTGTIATSYLMTATPVIGRGQDKDLCTEFTLSSAGAKGGLPSKAACWGK